MNINTKFDVVGVGNAIVDILAKVDDSFITENGLKKGNMVLIEENQAEKLYNSMPPAVEKSGGSAANTVAGIVSLGGKAAFIGKTKDDQLGKIFRHDLTSIGVHFSTPAAKHGLSTARCMVAVTPDAERTMATFLGAAKEITIDDVEEDVIATAKVTYLEGYLWYEQHAKAAMREAVSIATKYNRKISLSLSDQFCVINHKEEFLELIKKNVDILFANEEEIKELLGIKNIHQSLDKLKSLCEIVAITLGSKGSSIIADNKHYEIPPAKSIKVVDTTGAGDLYASGFLYAYTNGYNIRDCGKIATIAASEVITHIGARPEVSLASLI